MAGNTVIHQNVYHFGWQCWCIAASTALHSATWPEIYSACHITSATALFLLLSTGCSTHCAFYHWLPHFSSICFICLEQFARVSLVIAIAASFPQQTGDWTVCLILQLFWVWWRTSHCIDYCVTSLLLLIHYMSLQS